MRALRALVLVPIAAALAAPAPALAQENKILRDYQKNGQVNPCSYSKGQLQKGLKGLPPDIQQYAPGLADQLRRPCAAAPVPAAATPQAPERQAILPTAAPPEPSVPRPPAPHGKARSALRVAAPDVSASPTGTYVPRWLQLVLGLLAATLLLIALAVRYGGLDPETLTRPLRAASAEGGGRTSDALAGLRDRLRLGR